MSKSRLELKVGLFVMVGLVVLGAMMVKLNKGASLFRHKYYMKLSAENVGGLKTQDKVLMSGVQIGMVSSITLVGPECTNVDIELMIYQEFPVRRGSRFVIQQSGLLGDQYVSIIPSVQGTGHYANGDTALAEEPFDVQEVLRSASGFIKRIDQTAIELNDAIVQVRAEVLNDQTLTNLAVSVNNLRSASERAVKTVNDIDDLFVTNGSAISIAATNIISFSQDLKHVADSLNQLIATNRETVDHAAKNIESSSETLKNILDGVDAGKGTVGVLLRDPQTATNIAEIVNNLSITTSNLNRRGLWGILWSHKPASKDTVQAPVPAATTRPQEEHDYGPLGNPDSLHVHGHHGRLGGQPGAPRLGSPRPPRDGDWLWLFMADDRRG
jgi:phospholipid/cholesterol/gamma-HCH transport system substrate-binding protein